MKIINLNNVKLNKGNTAVITHDDLDGVASHEALCQWLGERLDVKLHFSPKSDDTFKFGQEFLNELPELEYLFVLDRDINDYHVRTLVKQKPSLTIIHIDHHQNSKHFKNDSVVGFYGVDPESYNKAAAELVVDYCEMFLCDNRKISLSEWVDVKDFVLTVGDWDTFRWKRMTGYKKKLAQYVLAMEKIHGGLKSMELIKECADGKLTLNDSVQEFAASCYRIYKNTLDSIQEQAKNNIILKEVNGVKYGILCNIDSDYYSLTASKLTEELDLMFIANIYSSGIVSCRGNNNSNIINLKNVVDKLPGGGGGHFNSAGGNILPKMDTRYGKDKEPAPKEHDDKLVSSFIEFISEIIK